MAVQLNLKDSIERAISNYMAEVREESIKTAVVNFEKEVRAGIGRVALSLADYYSVERIGTDIVIHVRIGKDEG